MDNAAYHNVLSACSAPKLQPIETCWGIVKNQVARNCDYTIGF